MANAALIWACVPDRVRLGLPLTPALMVAPLRLAMVTLPLPTVRRVLARLPSTSLTLKPLMVRLTSSVAVWVPGTVLTGASLTEMTVMVATAVFDVKAPSFTVTLITRAVVLGFSEELANLICSIASAY